MQKIKSIDQDHKATNHVSPAKMILAKSGGKCATLADRGGDLATMAHTTVAQHRRVTKLLASVHQQHVAEKTTLKADGAMLRDRERALLKDLKDVRAALVAMETYAQRTEKETAAKLADQEQLVAEMGEALVQANENRVRQERRSEQLERKLVRAKTHAMTFFDDKRALEREVADLRVSRDAALARAGRLCVVCLEDRDLLVSVPCGHACVCAECVRPVGVPCAMCREIVERNTPLFVATE